jgi:hypothetical protein
VRSLPGLVAPVSIVPSAVPLWIPAPFEQVSTLLPRAGRYFGPLLDENAFVRTGFAPAGPSLQTGAEHSSCCTASIVPACA